MVISVKKTMHTRFLALVLSAVLLLPALAGCSKKTGAEKDLAYPIDGEPVCLDPQIAADETAKLVTGNCFEGLVRLDESGAIVPGAAQRWDVSADGRTYTFHLREGMKWHIADSDELEELLGKGKTIDTTLNAEDFAFGLKRALLPETGMASAKALYAIENAQAVHRGTARSDQLGVRVVNASTLEIRLARADSAFLYALTLPMSMPCDEAFFLATSGRYGLERKYLICNGPFYLSKWNHDKSPLLKKNPDYQGETTVSPATVSLYINTDGQSRLDKLLEGRYDAALLEQGQAHALDERSGITTQEIPNITWSICFNAGNALLKNGNLRIALCQGLNRSALEPASGLTAEAQGFVPASCMLGSTSYREQAGAVGRLAYNADEARRRWESGLDALGQKSATLTILCAQEHADMIRKLIQTWQGALGITLILRLEAVDRAELRTRLEKGDYEIAFAPVTASGSSAVEFLSQFASAASGNLLNYSSEAYNKIISSMNMAASRQLIQLCKQAETHLIQNGLVYPLYAESSFFAMAQNVSGIVYHTLDGTVRFLKGERLDS